MPNELTVQSVGPVLGASENPAQSKSETFVPPAQAPPATAPLVVTNPTLRFDPASGLVVLEYRNEAGQVTTSIPTLRQLEAYRQWNKPLPGQPAVPESAAHHKITPATRKA